MNAAVRCSRPPPPADDAPRRALQAAMVVCLVLLAAEAIAAAVAHSLALAADAAHIASDVLAIAIALLATHASAWPPTTTGTYGWRRAEVVGALLSVVTTWGLVVWILISALERGAEVIQCATDPGRRDCEPINAKIMAIIGIFGMSMNVILALVLHGGAHGHSHGTLATNTMHHAHNHSHSQSHSHNEDHNHSHNHNHDHDHNHSHGHHHDTHRHAYGGEGSDGLVDVVIEPDTAGFLVGYSDMERDEDMETVHSLMPETHSHSYESDNMNIRATMLHVFGDCLQSLAVILAACVMWIGNVWTKGYYISAHSYYNLADPILSFVFGIITIFTTTSLFKEVVSILLEEVPASIDYTNFYNELMRVPKVCDIEDLHIWSIGPNFNILSAHLCVKDCSSMKEVNYIVNKATSRCKELGITHTTIQLNHKTTVSVNEVS
ncbi:zinc transporter [Trypanosoma theileri]|uniref:Zinc transporter n=1 Tax=Trypanosoma theileri TaxID=67003 RepID=A0A1X0P8G6_9TRYP|nr:zinc transporter [Trypanosoma theileri]ORC93131.1 zinc transporter [Trypanosoma theileri]